MRLWRFETVTLCTIIVLTKIKKKVVCTIILLITVLQTTYFEMQITIIILIWFVLLNLKHLYVKKMPVCIIYHIIYILRFQCTVEYKKKIELKILIFLIDFLLHRKSLDKNFTYNKMVLIHWNYSFANYFCAFPFFLLENLFVFDGHS